VSGGVAKGAVSYFKEAYQIDMSDVYLIDSATTMGPLQKGMCSMSHKHIRYRYV